VSRTAASLSCNLARLIIPHLLRENYMDSTTVSHHLTVTYPADGTSGSL
jgi:hypothetical protein